MVFLNFYKEKFDDHASRMIFSPVTPQSRLNEAECGALESRMTIDEIRTVVWDCGSQKAPGPDGFSFLFIKKYWEILKHDIETSVVANPIHIKDFRPISLIGVQYKIIAKILANRLAKVVDKVISHEQSSFISGRKILDCPLMLNEVMDWYKSRNKKLMIFKVDFEKAYDSVSWEFLDHMLTSLGFGVKWRSWIQACLKSARSSILVNGSPSSEFSIERGLRQGDPLSPFLFIIIMEGLHLALKDVVQSGLLQGAKVGDSGMNISHLFYADDVVIISEWNRQEMDNIIRVLQVFYLASGMKINIAKSNVYGIGVSSDDIIDMARVTRCASGTIPFIYLGLSIGSNMNLIANWQSLIDRFRGKLSSWKANLLSIGDAGIDGKGCKSKGMWEKIVGSYSQLHARNVIPISTLHHKVGCGSSVCFWKDNWVGDGPLHLRYNRLFHLDSNANCFIRERIADGIWSWNWIRQRLGSRNEEALLSMVAEIENVSLSNQPDSWHWNIDPDGIFR
nr:putative RNA-directed DNA polymerase, eukaryota, reverse transcriptase zinc-binding domain protein [Tanacetum cinerariifolium]